MANLPPPNHVSDLPEDDSEEQPELAPEPDHLNGFALHQNPQPEGNTNRWILEVDEEEEEEEDPEMEEEMEEENDDDDDAEVINPYEEADPLNLPPQDSDIESEDMAVAPTPDDHEQEAELYCLVPSLLVPYSMRPILGDAAARDEGDDAATTSDPQPSQPPGSPHYHLKIMPPRAMAQAAIEKLVSDWVAAALAHDRAIRGNTNGAGGPGGNIGGNAAGQGGAPPSRECTYSSFMKCNPTSFHENEGAVELCRWFEKTESVFSISECAERNKVKFVAATLQDRALTWWNSQVATLGLEVANAKSWNDMKIMMREYFCPPEEIQRMEVELWNLRVKDSNISAYTQRFNELVLLCPEMVPSEKKKVEAYIRGLPKNIKGETTSSKPVVLNEAV
ncbi:putative reverse transcriptase domain-containing protein [Tanacetum coccineum]